MASAAAVYDLTNWLSGYASFNDIFSPQNTEVDAQLKPLSAARGKTYEGGLRLKLRDGKLNGHLAYYDTHLQNVGVSAGFIFVPVFQFVYIPSGQSYSHGIDAELNGEVFEGFQLAASYNLNRNNTTGFPATPGAPTSLSNLTPKHSAKLWASYDVQSGGLKVLTLAGGFRAESKRSFIGDVCITSPCTFNTQRNYFFFSDKGYAVVDALINYRAAENLELSLNLYNVFDKKYISQPSGINSGNYYATPRSFMLTVRTVLGDHY